MRRKGWLKILVLSLAVTLPLVWAALSSAESGCHRCDGGTVVKTEAPKR